MHKPVNSLRLFTTFLKPNPSQYCLYELVNIDFSFLATMHGNKNVFLLSGLVVYCVVMHWKRQEIGIAITE